MSEVRDDGDLGRRLAWLLLTHRLHAGSEYADPASFATALTEAGSRATSTDILGWEAAAELPPYDVVAAWERVCGLNDGSLATVFPFLASSLPRPELPLMRPDPPPTSPARVDELIASVSDVSARPADWVELGQRLGASNGPGSEPTAGEADRVARGLVTQLPRCVGVSYRQLNVAAKQLCRLPAVQDAVVTRVREHVTVGAAQQASDPVTLLSMIPTRAAAVLVLEMLERPPSRTLLPLVVWVAARKQSLGHFTDAERARLEVAVLTRWRSGARTAQRELAELISVLPGGFREVLTRAAMGDGEAMSEASAAEVAREIAAAATPGHAPYDEDPLLTRLVREALFHHQTERRHLASVLVEASPFATAVADQVVALLASTGDGPLRFRAAALTCYVTGESHRMRLHRFVDDPQVSVAIFATYALGRLRYAVTTDLALRRGLPAESTPTAQARLHALGMTGSPALSALASRSGGEQWQRRAAEWWLAGGPAIR